MLKTLRRRLHIPKLPWRKPNNKRQPIKRNNVEKQKRVIDNRKSTIKRRKNFGVSLIILATLWLLLTITVVFVDPEISWAIVLFIVLVFSTLTFTFSFLFINTRRGIIVGGAITLFLVLRYFGIGTMLNAILIIALAGVVEYYFKNGT